jgi:hypothetical protein
MAGRMPVLRGEGVPEGLLQQAVDHRHHGIAIGHRQLAAGHEGGLDIGDAENVGVRIDHDAGHAAASEDLADLRAGLRAGGTSSLSGYWHHGSPTQRQHSGTRALQQ